MSTIQALGSQVPTSYFSNTNPDLAKDLSQVLIEFLKTKDVPKLINYLTQWLGRFQEISPNLKNSGAFAGDVKNFMSGAESYSKFEAVRKAVEKLVNTLSIPNWTFSDITARIRDIIRQASDLSNSVCDGIKLGSKFFANPYSREVDGIAAGATCFGSINNLIDDIIKIYTRVSENTWRDYQLLTLDFFSLGMDVCYIAVGSIGLYTFATGVVVPEILIFLTAALVCSICSFFFKNFVDPKMENADPNKTTAALRATQINSDALGIRNATLHAQNAALRARIAELAPVGA